MQDCFLRCDQWRQQKWAFKEQFIITNWHACRPHAPNIYLFISYGLKNEFLRDTRALYLHESAFRYLLLIILKEIINNRHLNYVLHGRFKLPEKYIILILMLVLLSKIAHKITGFINQYAFPYSGIKKDWVSICDKSRQQKWAFK